MAKTPRKTQDPTEAALSAIEEALQMGGEPPADEVPPERPASRARETRQEAPPPPASRTVRDDGDPFAERPRPGRRMQRTARSAANDDRQSVGQILAALNSKPSYVPYYVAGGAAALWIILGSIIGYYRAQEDIAATTSLREIFGLPYFWTFLATLAMPAAVMFLFAAMVRRAQEMRSVSSAMTEVTLRLAEPEGVSADAIVSVSQAIRREVAALGDGIERAIARASELETMVKSEVSTLERAYDDNELRVRTLVEQLQHERDTILSHASRLREAMSGAHEAFNLDVEGISDTINSTITEGITRITDHLVTQSESARTQLITAGDSVLETYSGKSNELTDRLTAVGVEVAKAIIAKGDAVGEVLTSRLRALEEQLAQRGNEIADRVAADSTALGRRITDGLQGFDTTVKVYGTSLLEQITQTVHSVNEGTRINLTAFNEGVDQRIARVEQTLDARTQSLNETLANRTLEFARTVTDGAKNATEAVDKSVAGMSEYFANKAHEIATTISERATAIDKTLGTQALEISGSLDSRIKRFEEQVVAKLEAISGSVETKGLAVADALGAKVESVTKSLREDADKVEKTLTDLSDQVSKKLVQDSEQVGKNLFNHTQTIISTQEKLRSEVIAVLERLGEANAIIMQVYEGVTSNLGPVAGDMTDRVSAFQHSLDSAVSTARGSIEHMDNQVHGLREIANSVLRDVGMLTQRFEDQGRLIAGTADTLFETHRRIDQTLSDRRDTFEKFSSLLTTRATDLEERLVRFNRMLEETLGGAESRAHEIAKMVADAATQSTQEVTKQYELMRTATEEQREITTTSMKISYDKTMDEVKALFSDTNQRFSGAAQELRQIADEVQQSLDQTRQELKRGVFELPHETRESMEAMRRVVADQIKALSELNEIVAHHGRSIDMVEPRRVAFRPEVVSGGGGRFPPPREAAVVAEVQRAPRSTGPRGEPGGPRRTEREPREPREPREAGERGGWLTDLLSRSSRDGGERGERSPLHTIESLDSLSVDIAHMIDHDSAVELWERYKRGERHIFTRKLYTNQGQKTFEEIRRRYRKSAEFRDTVDRYIDEFERLLDQVSRDDRGQVLSRTYLTSDTGKVYTLLAHAAGRLD